MCDVCDSTSSPGLFRFEGKALGTRLVCDFLFEKINLQILRYITLNAECIAIEVFL